MKSLADGLPPEIARQIHPDWRKNEADYWNIRDQVLEKHEGQWIAFADGAVIASDRRPMTVYQAAQESGKHPYVIRAGHEDEPCRMRRTSFAYDPTYGAEPLPVVRAEFRRASGRPGIIFDQVIPDTGADASALPWSDCRQMHLDPNAGLPGVMGGVAGGSAKTLRFFVWVELDGKEYPCTLQADFVGNERILGRDVLNALDILFRGPSGEVVVNP